MTADYADYAGLRQMRRCRRTGHMVGIYYGPEAELDTDDGRQPWSTVCEEHGTVCCHETLALARWHAPYADEWCEECMAELAERPA